MGLLGQPAWHPFCNTTLSTPWRTPSYPQARSVLGDVAYGERWLQGWIQGRIDADLRSAATARGGRAGLRRVGGELEACFGGLGVGHPTSRPEAH